MCKEIYHRGSLSYDRFLRTEGGDPQRTSNTACSLSRSGASVAKEYRSFSDANLYFCEGNQPDLWIASRSTRIGRANTNSLRFSYPRNGRSAAFDLIRACPEPGISGTNGTNGRWCPRISYSLIACRPRSLIVKTKIRAHSAIYRRSHLPLLS